MKNFYSINKVAFLPVPQNVSQMSQRELYLHGQRLMKQQLAREKRQFVKIPYKHIVKRTQPLQITLVRKSRKQTPFTVWSSPAGYFYLQAKKYNFQQRLQDSFPGASMDRLSSIVSAKQRILQNLLDTNTQQAINYIREEMPIPMKSLIKYNLSAYK